MSFDFKLFFLLINNAKYSLAGDKGEKKIHITWLFKIKIEKNQISNVNVGDL